MKIRKCSEPCGVRQEVMRKLRGVEGRCEMLERELNTLALAERLRRAVMRISELEERAAISRIKAVAAA